MFDYDGRTAILAAGDFPSSPLARGALETARHVVCCDGAAARYVRRMRRVPDAIVGDLDSLPPSLMRRCRSRIARVDEQDDNDLAKAFRHCIARGWGDVVVLGATGGREDHSIANVSWLAEFASEAPDVAMVTDHGVFTAVTAPGGAIPTLPGMQLSFFAPGPVVRLSATGVKFPVEDLETRRWFTASLNEATGDVVELALPAGTAIVFRAFP